MSISVDRWYKLKDFKPGQIAIAFDTLINIFGADPTKSGVKGSFEHKDGTTEDRSLMKEELDMLCEINDKPSYFFLCLYLPKEGNNFDLLFVHVRKKNGFFKINYTTPDAAPCTKLIEETEKLLTLEYIESPKFESPVDPKLEELENRLSTLEKESGTQHLKCFLSFRFNEPSEAIALKLTRFFELLGVNVVTGAGYEPRRVTDKVKDKLAQKVDFFVYLVTREGESTWTRDELAYALGKGYAVIVLVEKGANLGGGLLTDHEYLEFEGNHIGDTFVGLLEALRYVRQEKAASEAPKVDELK